MADEIDELVDWQLSQKQNRSTGWLGICANCGNPWHGFPTSFCWGSLVVASKCRELLPVSVWQAAQEVGGLT